MILYIMADNLFTKDDLLMTYIDRTVFREKNTFSSETTISARGSIYT